MTNLEKFNNTFMEVFAVDDSVLNDSFSKETIDTWDSVHQLNIIALLEESFEVMFEPEDIMEFTSYTAGKAILNKYDIEL
jgi:acyl carrier protein